jgi:ABC-2 type transport system permease protein
LNRNFSPRKNGKNGKNGDATQFSIENWVASPFFRWQTHTVARAIGIYVEYGRIAFLKTLAYRLRYYTGILSYMINISVYYFIWKAIFTHGERIEGYDLGEMVTYVAVGWIARSFYFNNIDREIASQVTEGRIATELIKPIHYQLSHIASAFGESGFRMVLFTLPITIVAWLFYPVRLPAGPLHFALFFASLVLAFLIFAEVNFIVGLCALGMKSILALIRAKYFLVELLSGLLVPISFFPASVQRVSSYLPFQHISFTPLQIYLGKLQGAELLRVLAIQSGWTIGLFILGNFFWSLSVRKITIQGG